mgnify:CR=1 FL=1
MTSLNKCSNAPLKALLCNNAAHSTGVITDERSQSRMKGIYVVVASLFFCGALGYFCFEAINKHIDQESGSIVEGTLSDNIIQQLNLLLEVQSLISADDIDQANIKLSEATKTMAYILEKNCSLAKCEEALRKYESK